MAPKMQQLRVAVLQLQITTPQRTTASIMGRLQVRRVLTGKETLQVTTGVILPQLPAHTATTTTRCTTTITTMALLELPPLHSNPCMDSSLLHSILQAGHNQSLVEKVLQKIKKPEKIE